MEKIGIICEYNPFHKGHLYHINKIKEKYPDSLIILVLNGYFLQRGEISVLAKYDKVKLALDNKVDIILELPVLFGTQSADTFAYKAVEILNQFNVNRIIFGSESNDINKITMLAKKAIDKSYDADIKRYLNEGINYPTALANALKTDFDFLPNDLLATSYVKAILQINDKIIPETIKRTNGYLDICSNDEIVSASNIREKIKNNEDISKHVLNNTISLIKDIDYNLYFNLLKAIIIREDNLNSYLDVDEGIEFRLKEKIVKVNNLQEFIQSIKTKRYTYNRINRMLIHILLGIKKDDAKLKLDYIKILGFNDKGKKYLNIIKKDKKDILRKNKDSIIYQYEIKAAQLYDMLTNSNEVKKELSNKPLY